MYISDPINWLAPPNFTTQVQHNMPILPWVSIQRDALDQVEPDYPTDACLRRVVHQLHYEGMRGETIKNLADYAKLYKTRITKEVTVKMPDLRLPAPPDANFLENVKQFQDRNEHIRLAAGERWINNMVKMSMSNVSKHDYPVPVCPTTRNNIRNKLPSETQSNDLDLAQKLLNANLAKNTRKTNNSVQRTLTSLITGRDPFASPRSGDKELLLLRLIQQKPNLAASSVQQYMKTYNSILLSKGISPPPDTTVFKQLLQGFKNKDFNPRLAAAQPKRQAHTKETLALLAHALASMGPDRKNLWTELRVQALFTATLLAFWGCARLSDLCGAEKSGYSVRTTLLEKDFTLMKENGEIVGLEIFFGSEKVPHLAGSRVQLPKIPVGNLQRLCPVAAYIRYQKMKRILRPQASAPWLIDAGGHPITQRNLTTWLDLAIEKSFSNTDQIHHLRRLRGHSFRAALPTHMQNMGDTLTAEEKKLMGRWMSDSAYKLYCKNKTSRMNAAKRVINNLQNS